MDLQTPWPSAYSAIGPLVPPAVIGDLQIIVSELILNVVRQRSAGSVLVSVRLLDEGIEGRVCGDFGPEPPGPEGDAREALGLLLVDRIADRWRLELTDRLCIAFELATARRAAAEEEQPRTLL